MNKIREYIKILENFTPWNSILVIKLSLFYAVTFFSNSSLFVFQPITAVALSHDGAVLTTASEDGYVKFWRISEQSNSCPVCIHEFKPHDGLPLSFLKFCDNHTAQDQE